MKANKFYVVANTIQLLVYMTVPFMVKSSCDLRNNCNNYLCHTQQTNKHFINKPYTTLHNNNECFN